MKERIPYKVLDMPVGPIHNGWVIPPTLDAKEAARRRANPQGSTTIEGQTIGLGVLTGLYDDTLADPKGRALVSRFGSRALYGAAAHTFAEEDAEKYPHDVGAVMRRRIFLPIHASRLEDGTPWFESEEMDVHLLYQGFMDAAQLAAYVEAVQLEKGKITQSLRMQLGRSLGALGARLAAQELVGKWQPDEHGSVTPFGAQKQVRMAASKQAKPRKGTPLTLAQLSVPGSPFVEQFVRQAPDTAREAIGTQLSNARTRWEIKLDEAA